MISVPIHERMEYWVRNEKYAHAILHMIINFAYTTQLHTLHTLWFKTLEAHNKIRVKIE